MEMPETTYSVTQEEVDAYIKSVETFKLNPNTGLTTATLQCGYTIIETSSCVDPRNYSTTISEKLNLVKIKTKVWSLLGFALSQKLHAIRSSTHIEMVAEEDYHQNYIEHINHPNYNPENGRVLDDKGYSIVCDPKLGILCRMKLGYPDTKNTCT